MAEYAFYLVQCLCFTNQRQKAFQVCQEKLLTKGGHIGRQARQICANILYEEGQYQDALSVIQQSNTMASQENTDGHESHDGEVLKARYQNALNEGCIYFQQQDYRQALGLFESAIAILGQLNQQEEASNLTNGTELFYNLALTYFEL